MIISPSILSANFSELKNEIERVNEASWLHIDVMDGVFVPNISFGAKIQKEIKPFFKDMIFDTHLMIIDPIKYIKDFYLAGSDYITFHLEAKSDINQTIDLIHEYHMKAGLSIKPNTKVEEIEKYLDKLDLVLVMSVEPGFGGQKYMPSAKDKIIWLDQFRKKNHLNYLISVDGGINDTTFNEVKEAGVDVAVMGSYLFKQENPNEIIKKLNK